MIKYFIVYDNNGKIIRSGTCPEFDFDNQAQDGENIIEGVADQLNQYVKNGNLTNLPDKPSKYHEFDYTNELWVLNNFRAELDVKSQRNQLLAASDFYDTISAKQRMSPELFSAWAVYRQDLRDITDQEGYPLLIDWPVSPQ